MATLEWGDTFDHYAITKSVNWTTTPMSKKWTTVDSDTAGVQVAPDYARPGSGGGNGLMTNSRRYTKTLSGGALSTRMAGCWVNLLALNTSAGLTILTFVDVTTEQLSLRLDGSGHIVVSRAGTTLATSTNTISANTWYWMEFKATIHNTAGNYEVKVNGTSTNWIPAQGGTANTRGTGSNNSATGIQIGSNNLTIWYDDVVVADDFTGQIQGYYVPTAGPGNYSQFTPNSGSNDGAVRNAATDDDNSFNASATSGNKDTFVMAKLPVSGTPTIIAVQHVIYAKQDAGVQRTIRPKQRSSSTDYNGTSVNTTTTYAFYTEVKATDPATTVAWTKTSFEAAELGYENV